MSRIDRFLSKRVFEKSFAAEFLKKSVQIHFIRVIRVPIERP